VACRRFSRVVAVVFALAMSLPAPSALAVGPDDEADSMPDVLAPQSGPLGVGKIVAINRDTCQLELEHMPIKAYYMQGMTMVFKVADPSLLYGRSPGDKIRFQLERQGRSYVITRIENSN
jgi:Cu/Ag efflux protein CusF